MITYLKLVLVLKVLTPVQIDLGYWLLSSVQKGYLTVLKVDLEAIRVLFYLDFLVVLSFNSLCLSIPLVWVWWSVVQCSTRCTQGGEESCNLNRNRNRIQLNWSHKPHTVVIVGCCSLWQLRKRQGMRVILIQFWIAQN